jgi:DNA-directed RNA polymerase specialized sigma24 family protein
MNTLPVRAFDALGAAPLCAPELRLDLVRYVRSRYADHTCVEDLVQSTLLEAWARRDLWASQPSRLKGLAVLIAKRNVIDDMRYAAVERRRACPTEPVADGDACCSARDELRRIDVHVRARASMRRSFDWLVRALRGDSYGEIGATDGVTAGTVKSAIANLRAKLRAARQK